MLTNEQIRDYQRRYKEHYGKKISQRKATEQGRKLLILYKIIIEYLSKKQNTS